MNKDEDLMKRTRTEERMNRLSELCSRHGQSPWLDNLRRDWLADGTVAMWLERGVRGMTSNPTIFGKAMASGHAYDEQFKQLIDERTSVEDAYWEMVVTDIHAALALFRPVHDESDGVDGFVSLELAPALARDTAGSMEAARRFHEQIAAPNLYVKIPGTAEGVPAVQRMVAEGRNINITLIFGLERYAEVIDAYLSGLEELASDPASDLSSVRSVASFFVSRVDTEIDRRLESIASAEALDLRGRAAVAQAKLAYRQFRRSFSGPRWEELAAKGAHLQRPLWASTSTKNPDFPDTLYVDSLIGPDTVNTMPEATLEAFDDHGTLAATIEDGVEESERLFERLADIGVDMADVSRVLEDEGVASFAKSYDELVASLEGKAAELA